MASPGDVIGSAFVEIRPALEGFENLLKGGVGKSVEKAGSDAGRQFDKAFKGAIEGVALLGGAVIAAGGAAVDLASKYDSALSMISAKAGITKQAADAIGQAFLSTAGSSTFTATQIAQAFAPVSGQLETLTHGALTSAQSLSVMQAAMAGTEATGGDLTATTDALARVMLAFGDGPAAAAGDMDILTNAANKTNQAIPDVAGAVDKLQAKLGEAAPSLADSATLIVSMNNAGLAGSRAVIGMTKAFEGLLVPTPKVKGEIHDLGLKVYDANGQFVGMSSLISQLQPKLEAMTPKQRELALTTLFGAQQAQIMNDVISNGAAAFDTQSAAIAKTGSAQTAAQAATDNFKSKLEEAKSAIEDAGISIGTVLLPYVTEAADWLGKHLPDAINTLHRWIDMHKQDIAHWAGVIKDVLAQAFQVLGNVLSIALPLLASLGQWIGQNLGLLTGLGGALSILYVGRKTGGLLGGLITDLGTLLGLISRVPASLPGTGGGGGGVVPVGGAGGAVATAASVITTGAIVIAGAAALDIATVSVLNAVAPPGPADPGYKPKPGTRGILGYIPDPAAESATEHMPTYLSKPGQAFDPAKNDQVITDAMQQYAAEILKERDNLPPKFNDLSDEIAKSVVAGSNVHNAIVDLAALTTAGVTTNQPQVRQYLSHWNEIQNGALDTKDAQYEYASELASGKIQLGAPMAGFLQAWNIAHADGITMDQATAISASAAQLAAKHGQDFASGVKYLAIQQHLKINDILGAYTLTAEFAQSMAQWQQNLYNGLPSTITVTTPGTPGHPGTSTDVRTKNVLFDEGGLLTEPVNGIGLWTGTRYGFAGQGTEFYGSPAKGPTGGNVTVNQTFHITGDPATVQAIIHQEFRSLELSLRAQ